MTTRNENVFILRGISTEDLDTVIKLAARKFQIEREATRDALRGDRRDKVNYLKVIIDDPEQDLVDELIREVAHLSANAEVEEAKPARRTRKAAPVEEERPQRRRRQAAAKKPARAEREYADKAGKILIPGDAAKIAATLHPRIEVAGRGTTVLTERAAFVVEAHPGKGVVIKDFLTSKVNGPLRYVRRRLSGTPWIKKARVHIGHLPENKIERLGLHETRDGTFGVSE